MKMMEENTKATQVEQINEALRRMKMLKMHPNSITEFKNDRKLNLSRTGILYWLDDEIMETIRLWEEETGNVVYHIIDDLTSFGRCLSYLYVSPYKEEWERDNNDIEEGYAFVYVDNIDDSFCSEYGTIGIRPYLGGILRTA